MSVLLFILGFLLGGLIMAKESTDILAALRQTNADNTRIREHNATLATHVLLCEAVIEKTKRCDHRLAARALRTSFPERN